MKDKIQAKIDLRQNFHDVHEKSWDASIGEHGEYALPEPKEIDELGIEIKADLKTHFADLPVDFIIESLTMLGEAPNVMYDDNGMFAVSGDGMQPIVYGHQLIEGSLTVLVTKKNVERNNS